MKYIVVILFLLFSLNVYSQTEKNETKLTVEIDNIDEVKGNVIINIYKDEEEYKEIKSASYAYFFPVTEKYMQQIIKLPYGTYSLQVFHDENENKKIDMDKNNHPVEKFGYSNNFLGKYASKPPYKKTLISLEKPEKTIKINLK